MDSHVPNGAIFLAILCGMVAVSFWGSMILLRRSRRNGQDHRRPGWLAGILEEIQMAESRPDDMVDCHISPSSWKGWSFGDRPLAATSKEKEMEIAIFISMPSESSLKGPIDIGILSNVQCGDVK